MKYRSSAWYWKALAWVLAAASLAFGTFTGFLTLANFNGGSYGSRVYQETYQCTQAAMAEGDAIINKFRSDPTYDKWDRFLEDTNLRFIILREQTGEVMAMYTEPLNITVPKELSNNPWLHESSYSFRLGEKGSFLEAVYVMDYYFGARWSAPYSEGYSDVSHETPAPVDSTENESYQILFLLPQTLQNRNDRIWNGYHMFRYFDSWKVRAPWCFGGCALVFLLCALYLSVTADRKPGQEELHLTFGEKIPFDLVVVLDGLALLGGAALLAIGINNLNDALILPVEFDLLMAALSAGMTICALVLLWSLVTFVCRCKAGKWWRTTLTYRVLRWGWDWFKKPFVWCWHILVQGFRSMPLVPRGVLVLFALAVAEFFLILFVVEGGLFFLVLFTVCNLLLLMGVIWALGQLRLLQKAGQAMADGTLDAPLDTSYMYWDFKLHGENLKSIAGGLNKAVEKQMKSERLKTELITNVSHDIKTPLTSIINYVDLLQKPHTEAEGVQYLEVLDRQAKRLKKLTENLVEASKASTGNLAVTLEPIRVMELVNQSVEEYRDRLEAGRLETVVDLRGDLEILADGKLMWRIMDNLLNNVIKYAMSGTRVYVTARKQDSHVTIAVKNISRDPLNVSADELLERFVRGDSSRHTEGTGLGLNIAQSLTQLQNGRFTLTVDGDFFKAEATLPMP